MTNISQFNWNFTSFKWSLLKWWIRRSHVLAVLHTHRGIHTWTYNVRTKHTCDWIIKTLSKELNSCIYNTRNSWHEILFSAHQLCVIRTRENHMIGDREASTYSPLSGSVSHRLSYWQLRNIHRHRHTRTAHNIYFCHLQRIITMG